MPTPATRWAVLMRSEGKVYAAVTLRAPEELAVRFDGSFACMIWDHDGRFTPTQRYVLARSLLDAGCRCVVCGGENCEAWHDDADEAAVARQVEQTGGVEDAPLVMTTWHQGEGPDEVAHYFVVTARLAGVEISSYLVLHIGEGDAMEAVDAAVRRYARGDADV